MRPMHSIVQPVIEETRHDDTVDNVVETLLDGAHQFLCAAYNEANAIGDPRKELIGVACDAVRYGGRVTAIRS